MGIELDDVPQQVPRAEMAAGTPKDVTLAPSVAPVVVIAVAVGLVTVGTALAAQLLPFQVVPAAQAVVNVPSTEYPVPVVLEA